MFCDFETDNRTPSRDAGVLGNHVTRGIGAKEISGRIFGGTNYTHSYPRCLAMSHLYLDWVLSAVCT